MPVQIRVQSAVGDTIVTVFNDLPDQIFTLPAKGKPTGITIDPNNWILKTVIAPTILGPIRETPEAIKVYPNPASEMLTIEFIMPSTGAVSVSLFTQLGVPILARKFESLPTGKQTIALPVNQLAMGKYILSLDLPNSRQAIPVILGSGF
jgi:aminopeptidase N